MFRFKTPAIRLSTPGAIFLALTLSACGGSQWSSQDLDGDGYTTQDGDCWDDPGETGVNGLTGADIYPNAMETWYDGLDQDCKQDDDYDADRDGYVPDEYAGLTTMLVDGTGDLPTGDCWDDPLDDPLDEPN